MNTYGLFSVNSQTFQIGGDVQYSTRSRAAALTYLKVHNLTLNILGYFPLIHSCCLGRLIGYISKVPFLSGCIRIASGVGGLLTALTIGDPDSKLPGITGRLYYEALITSVAQIGRGILEAFVPYGWVANIVVDIAATPYNFSNRKSLNPNAVEPHYPHIFKVLTIV